MASDGELDEGKLIYDWNSVEKVASLSPKRQIRFFCETLRDGIQSPSVRDPDIADKIKLVEIADSLGVHHIDIGLPGAGKRAIEDCTTLAEFIRDNKLAIKPACAARTHEADVGAILAWGFAPWTGGPITMIDQTGLKEFVAQADTYAAKYGDRFSPPQLLRDMAAKGETFYGKFAGQKAAA